MSIFANKTFFFTWNCLVSFRFVCYSGLSANDYGWFLYGAQKQNNLIPGVLGVDEDVGLECNADFVLFAEALLWSPLSTAFCLNMECVPSDNMISLFPDVMSVELEAQSIQP